jgi:hypothetical protein
MLHGLCRLWSWCCGLPLDVLVHSRTGRVPVAYCDRLGKGFLVPLSNYRDAHGILPFHFIFMNLDIC